MNARVSVVTTFGPGDDDTIEHVILATCRVINCGNQANYDDTFCTHCRDELDGLGLRDMYPKRMGLA